MWAVVPVKEIGRAKRRLAGHLESDERRRLVEAMLGDVLERLGAAEGLEGVLVVTRDPRAAEIARDEGAEVLAEKGDGGLNAALEQAALHLQDREVRSQLVVPGDVPSASGEDISAIVRSHDQNVPAVSIVSDRRREGTNALATTPPGLVRFRFGIGSFAAHRAEARTAGVEPCVLELPGLEFDVDEPADVEALADRSVGERTRRCHRDLQVLSPLLGVAGGAP